MYLGQGCWALSQICGIAEDKLKKYNVNGICDNLQVGPYVSCSEGSLPDFPPKPELDGSLKTYTIKKDDDCQSIANRNSVTVDDINNRNKNTWGWSGYKYLLPDAKIYLSTESPPMRAEVDNAICGPQASGTEKPEIVVRVYGYFSRNGRAAS